MPEWRVLLLLAVLAGGLSSPVEAAAREMTAREYFDILPTTIFENTPEGLSDSEKRELLENGRADFWQVHTENRDGLDMLSLPFGDSMVSLRVFRGAGAASSGQRGTLLAIGTTGTPMCTLELWREDAAGRIVPVDAPDEPASKEYFAAGAGLPKGVQLSVFFCVTESGLEAVPVFWASSGVVHVPVAHRLFYVWDEGQFKKRVQPVNR